MDVSSRVLSELATREAALDAQIEAARAEARQTVAAAEARAAGILQDAEQRVKAMQAEHEQSLTAQMEQIRSAARTEANAHAEQTRLLAQSKLGQAVDTIIRAVLP